MPPNIHDVFVLNLYIIIIIIIIITCVVIISHQISEFK